MQSAELHAGAICKDTMKGTDMLARVPAQPATVFHSLLCRQAYVRYHRLVRSCIVIMHGPSLTTRLTWHGYAVPAELM